MTALALLVLVAGLVAAVALLARARRAVHGRAPAEVSMRSPAPPRVGEVMLPSPSVISEELVVEETRRRFPGGLSGALPVIDHAGHAVGVLHAGDIIGFPPLARASCLVAPLVDRNPSLLAEAGADAAEVLGREAVARTGFAIVTDRRSRLAGVAWCEPPPEQEEAWSSPAFASTSPTTPT